MDLNIHIPNGTIFLLPMGKTARKNLKIHIHTLYIFELSFYTGIRMSAGVGMVTAEIKNPASRAFSNRN